MKYLVHMQFGSHVYGTNVATSDHDYKAVYLPDPKDILLQRAKPTITQNTKADHNSRNTPEDVDVEIFSLQQYLKLLCEGQTVALDMLFGPKEFYQGEASPIWEDIKRHKERFLHSGVTAFVGYARQQAAKYGIKGTRVAASREALTFLNNLPDHNKALSFYSDAFEEFFKLDNEFIKLVLLPSKKDGQLVKHLEVCNRKVPFNVKVSYAIEVIQKIFDAYGARALQAEKNEGIDWKALGHAVRVNAEAVELLTTKNITFPRPEKELLLKIRKAELPYKQVAEIIEQGLKDLEAASLISPLPKKPDLAFADEFIAGIYEDHIIQTSQQNLEELMYLATMKRGW